MGNVWLKIKIWTKVTFFCLLLIYVLMFVINNNSTRVKTWYWLGKESETSVLLLMLYVFLAGVVMTVLVRTTFKTISQVREMQHKNRTSKLEKQMAEMRAKAGMLRSRSDVSTQLPAGSEPESFPADEG